MGALAVAALKTCHARRSPNGTGSSPTRSSCATSGIDELEKEIDRLCLEFIVRQQPVAGTLRFAYATIKINSELERVGDYAESIARQIVILGPLEFDRAHRPLPRDRRSRDPDVARSAIEAFLTQDAALARRAMEAEDAVDRLRHQLNAEIW